MIDKSEIARRIIELRRERFEENERKCAKFLEINYITYRDYEAGRVSKLDTLEKISSRFGVTLDWLVLGHPPKYITRTGETAAESPSPYGLSEGERDILRLYRGADEVTRKYAKEMLEGHQEKSKKNAGA